MFIFQVIAMSTFLTLRHDGIQAPSAPAENLVPLILSPWEQLTDYTLDGHSITSLEINVFRSASREL